MCIKDNKNEIWIISVLKNSLTLSKSGQIICNFLFKPSQTLLALEILVDDIFVFNLTRLWIKRELRLIMKRTYVLARNVFIT